MCVCLNLHIYSEAIYSLFFISVCTSIFIKRISFFFLSFLVMHHGGFCVLLPSSKMRWMSFFIWLAAM